MARTRLLTTLLAGVLALAVAGPVVPAGARARAAAATAGHRHHGRHRHHRHRAPRRAGATAAAPTVLANAGPIPPPNQPADPGATCPDANLVPDAGNGDRIAAATLCLVDVERARRGLGALTANAALAAAASQYAARMVAEGFYAHVAPDGSTLATRDLAAGYAAPTGTYVLGENLAAASTAFATPAQVVAGWMASPEHRANLLSPDFRETGIAVAAGLPASVAGGAAAGVTYVEELGARGRDLVVAARPLPGS